MLVSMFAVRTISGGGKKLSGGGVELGLELGTGIEDTAGVGSNGKGGGG